tara:strand:- start:335 stop:3799 length:3465 start_codon:yes stop_codon:yes gene_type:complete
MSSTKSYYIDINRFSAQDSNSTQTNIWDFALRDTIVAPAGSEVAIHQAFINQKGITGQSIELDEDITETINFYAYLTEGEHPIPIVQNPISTKRSMKHDYNDSAWHMLDLFNNSEGGRAGLWNALPTNGTIAHLNTQNFGGCGVPLILGREPKPSSDNSTVLITAITPPNSIAGQMRITVTQGQNNFTFNTDDFEAIRAAGLLRAVGWSPGEPRPDASEGNNGRSFSRTKTTDPAGLDVVIHRLYVDDTITSGGFAGYQYGYGSFVSGFPGDQPSGTYTINVRNSQTFLADQLNFGNLPDGFIPKVNMRVSDITGAIPSGAVIYSVDLNTAGIGVTCRIRDGRTQAPIAMTQIQNVQATSLTEDLSYYCEPKNLSVTLQIKKGVYGIEQLTTVINNQLNGTMKSGTKITINPVSAAVGTGTNNGTIAPNDVGFTTTVVPMEYRDGPDGMSNANIDPTRVVSHNGIVGKYEYPNHTFISALDFAKTRAQRKAQNLVNRVNYSEMIGEFQALYQVGTSTALGDGFVGFIMNNNVRGTNQFTSDELTFTETGEQIDVTTRDNVGTTDTNAKAISDYQIGGSDAGTVGKGIFTVGAPETNIQYDTDNSAFSINNLHSSWRIPSTDISGTAILNKGEVAVGLKRCAIVCDVPPYSKFQNVFGSEGRDSGLDFVAGNAQTTTGLLTGYYVPEDNVIYGVNFLITTGAPYNHESAMSFISVGTILTGVPDAGGSSDVAHSTDKLPNAVSNEYGQQCEVIEIIPAMDYTESTVKRNVSAATASLPDDLYSFRIKFPDNWAGWNNNGVTEKSKFTNAYTDHRIVFKVSGQDRVGEANRQKMISAYQRPKSRTGGVIAYNFAYDTAFKYSDRPLVRNSPNSQDNYFGIDINSPYAKHASFKEFFSSEEVAKKIWKTKTLWGRLGFTYEQFNNEKYFEDIQQYCHPEGEFKLRGITTDTILDNSTLPSISTETNPSDYTQSAEYSNNQQPTVKETQTYETFDFNNPRTEVQRFYGDEDSKKTASNGRNLNSYSGSIHNMTTMVNVVAKATPVSAEELPTLSKFGYYLVTSDLVPTYKDIVSKGDPLGLLGVVPKTSLSSQDFIPLTESSIVQVLNQDTIINNIRVKILNPDLSNPQLNENSAVILRIDVPVAQNTQPKDKQKKKK